MRNFNQTEKLKAIKERNIEDKKDYQEKGLGIDFRDGIDYQDIERERDIYVRDQKRIRKKYDSKRCPNFRLMAEYLTKKFIERNFQLNKKSICKELKISMGTLNIFLSELNRFERFQPIRWIAIEGKKDWIECAGYDFRNSNKWLKKNIKGSISRTARTYQTKEKVKLEEENKLLENLKIKQKISN